MLVLKENVAPEQNKNITLEPTVKINPNKRIFFKSLHFSFFYHVV